MKYNVKATLVAAEKDNFSCNLELSDSINDLPFNDKKQVIGLMLSWMEGADLNQVEVKTYSEDILKDIEIKAELNRDKSTGISFKFFVPEKLKASSDDSEAKAYQLVLERLQQLENELD